MVERGHIQPQAKYGSTFMEDPVLFNAILYKCCKYWYMMSVIKSTYVNLHEIRIALT